MPVDSVTLNDWSGGMNNRAPASRLPESSARDLLNLYPAGGKLYLRPGQRSVYSGTNVRALFSLLAGLVVVDAGDLVLLTPSGGSKIVGAVPPMGHVAGDVMNETLYFCVGDETYMFSPQTGLQDWGVKAPLGMGTVSGADPGVLENGRNVRRYALTHTAPSGIESGALSSRQVGAALTLPAASAGHRVNLYMTEPDGTIYYWQGDFAGGETVTTGPTSASGKMLTTLNQDKPPAGRFIAHHKGVLFVSAGNFVYHTLPLDPHHVDLLEGGFFAYPEEVNAMCSGVAGVYLSSDKCYRLSGVGTERIQQDTVLEYPSQDDSMTTIEDGSAAWTTSYGLAKERADGLVEEPARETFVPPPGETRSAGVVAHNGEELFVANTQKSNGQNPLAAAGFFEAEVERP